MQEFFPKNKDGKYESALKSEYQSTFLPIFSHAEATIKATITRYFWELKSKRELIAIISRYIDEIDKKVPKDLPNRNAYIGGLRVKADKMIKVQYSKALIGFSAILGLILTNQTEQGEKIPTIKTPKQLIEYINKGKIKYNMWSQAKAAVRVQNYPQEIKKYINNLTGEVITTKEPGKKPISLWQKAELDVRYSHQMEMLQDHIDNGEDLCWISSHPDCSKRCEKWQGKLVSLTEHATQSGFRVKKVDGNWVYSLQDIMAQKDKYGYNNNIICGFNCRHYLIKYESGKLPPKEYSSQDVKRMRAINNQIREYERQIRDYKTKEKLYNVISDTKNATKMRVYANRLTQIYKQYCDKNGFAWYDYRIKI